MRTNSNKIISLIEELAPKNYAEKWDSVGFQLGNWDAAIDKVMVALEVTEEVVQEAEEKSVDLLIVHHPMIFKPIKAITENDYLGRLIRKCIKADIHVYVAHTNLDIADGGLNDLLAEKLEMKNCEVLKNTGSMPYNKLVVYVPSSHGECVEKAITSAGAGKMGAYDQCTFGALGKGSFRPLDGSTPYIGEINRIEVVEEIRLEAIVPHHILDKVIRAMLKEHPYEVPVYDVYDLAKSIDEWGIGRIGVLNEVKTLEELALEVKDVLKADKTKIVGSKSNKVRKVALCTGAGAEFIVASKQMGCDVLITGDVKYHEARLAEETGIMVIDAGHYETEHYAVNLFSEWLGKRISEKGYDVSLIVSQNINNPFEWV